MLARVFSSAVNGIEAYPIEVEVNSGWGDSVIVIVGLPDAAVKESRDRVGTALSNSGFKIPLGRITINLAPADVKKEGPSFDLPIAIGIAAAAEQIETDQLENFAIVGELALTGAVRPVKGVLPIALRARADGRVGILVPPENAAEAAVVSGLNVIPVANLREATTFLEGQQKIAPTKIDLSTLFDQREEDDLFVEIHPAHLVHEQVTEDHVEPLPGDDERERRPRRGDGDHVVLPREGAADDAAGGQSLGTARKLSLAPGRT